MRAAYHRVSTDTCTPTSETNRPDTVKSPSPPPSSLMGPPHAPAARGFFILFPATVEKRRRKEDLGFYSTIPQPCPSQPTPTPYMVQRSHGQRSHGTAATQYGDRYRIAQRLCHSFASACATAHTSYRCYLPTILMLVYHAVSTCTRLCSHSVSRWKRSLIVFFLRVLASLGTSRISLGQSHSHRRHPCIGHSEAPALVVFLGTNPCTERPPDDWPAYWRQFVPTEPIFTCSSAAVALSAT